MESNLVSLCMKIINSVVVVGLYYGFLTTFSIGPSYLFLLRARVMEEGEEGTEKKVSATTGFITGQLMMFISIYYVPLHLALGRPHTITVLALPVYYLGRIPSPIVTKKLKETSETEETDVEIETTSETKGTKQEQEGSTEEDPSPSLFSEEKEDPYKIDETKEIRVNGKEKTKDQFHFKETRYKNRPVYETYYLDGNQEQENSKLEIFKK
ncbi:hypothetical protein Prudu_1327S000100 [Prunus dulcis]|uniref:Translocon at the inner envelope membrane of chloroplasts 214 n=1 Tax=Prunus dulcis TaxID=3755 RepID=A0A5H2Y3H5_PRUDU|nr:hypothetical protein Prudu_1292S000200 [Prunus dulcis]BBN70000.1 hypothetical protein Prudu_1327S000100 [Prunus dulcis]